MFEQQSALASVLDEVGREGISGKRQLSIGEVGGWSLIQVAAYARTLDKFECALRLLLGTVLPTQAGEVTLAGVRGLFKIAPLQFWISTRDGDDLVPALLRAVGPAIGTVTPLTHGRTRIFVKGTMARELLAKGVAVDLHPSVFRINAFALTGLHHTPILIHHSDVDRYDLYVMRTFALSIWRWLIDAALPFGYVVSTDVTVSASA